MEDILKQILNVQMQMLAAQVAQIGLLQSIAAKVATKDEADADPDTVASAVDLKAALKGLEAASFQLATR